jgi:hypothetical protein
MCKRLGHRQFSSSVNVMTKAQELVPVHPIKLTHNYAKSLEITIVFSKCNSKLEMGSEQVVPETDRCPAPHFGAVDRSEERRAL